MEQQIQTSTLRTMNNITNIQKGIIIGLIVFGLISLLAGIFTERWYLVFMGVLEIILGAMMGDDNPQQYE